MILRLLAISISLLFITSCSNTQNYSSDGGEVSIAYLKSLCKGDHYRISNDYRIRGVVVANNWLGEFPQSIVVVDESGGIEIAIEHSAFDNPIHIFSEVEVLCSGLTLARTGGKISLGASPTGDFPLDNIAEEMINRYIRTTGYCSDFAPSTKRISEITPSDISTLCLFRNIRLCQEERGLKWCDVVDEEVVTTYRSFVDEDGDTLVIRTLPSCIYAENDIPTNEISVAGVVDYANNRYFVRIANNGIIE
jgi:hypothetical protein